jgi:hypothetical protein
LRLLGLRRLIDRSAPKLQPTQRLLSRTPPRAARVLVHHFARQMPIWRLERGAVHSNTWWVKQGNLLRNGHINASSTRANGVVATRPGQSLTSEPRDAITETLLLHISTSDCAQRLSALIHRPISLSSLHCFTSATHSASIVQAGHCTQRRRRKGAHIEKWGRRGG